MSARKPTHRLSMKIKQEDRKGEYAEVGSGWATPEGVISVKLNVGVVLDWRDREGTILTLFPIDELPTPTK